MNRRYFTPIWLFPFVLYSGVLVPPIFGIPGSQYFLFIIGPYFFVSTFMAAVPYRRREIGLGTSVVISLLAPFAIWVALVFSMIGLLYLLSALANLFAHPVHS